MQENHARLPGYLHCYVTSDGKVFNNGKEKTPICKKDRAPQIRLQENNRTRTYGLATLVATHFLPNPHGYTRIIFKDGNHLNCTAANIAWASSQEFSRYSLFPGKSLDKLQSSKAAKEEKQRQKRAAKEERKQSKEKEQQAKKETSVLRPSDASCLPIPGYPGYYASPTGEVWSKNRKLTPQQVPNKAARVKVKPVGGKLQRYTVARLVALTFLPNPHNHTCLIFKNRNKTNCTISNLEWVSEFCFRSFYKSSHDDILGTPLRRKKPVPPPIERHFASQPLTGYEGYFISPEGVVYKGNRLVHIIRRKGRSAKVILRQGTALPAIRRTLGLATLVAQHFIPNPKQHPYIIFKDRNHHHCHRDNIAWVDAETFMWYCGVLQKATGRKKIVVDREVAVQVTSHPLLRQYYKTEDDYWLEEAWKEAEGKLSRLCWDWQNLRSDCYLYFSDRARRFSIKRDPTGLLLCYIKGIRSRLKNEISDRMPIHQLLTTDESMRNRNNDYDEWD